MQKLKQVQKKKTKDRVTSSQRNRQLLVTEHLLRGRARDQNGDVGLNSNDYNVSASRRGNVNADGYGHGDGYGDEDEDPATHEKAGSHVPFIPSNFSKSNNFLKKLSQQPGYVDVFNPNSKTKFLYLRRATVDSAYDLEIVSHQKISEGRDKLREREEEEKKEVDQGVRSQGNKKTSSKRTKRDGPAAATATTSNNPKHHEQIRLPN